MTEGEQRVRPGTWPWWTGFAIAVVVALRLTHLAYQEGLPPVLEDYDKLVHASVAGSIAFFLDGALRRRSLSIRKLTLPVSSVVLLTIFGVEEFLQRFSVHRTPDVRDFAADVAGVVVFTWLSRRIGRRSEARGTNAAHDRAE